MRSFIGVSLLALFTGCPSDDADGVFVTATWSLRSVTANTPVQCPAAFQVAALSVRGVDGSPCNDAGDLVCVTRLTCDQRMGTSNKLVPGIYDVHIDITNDDASALYATTLPETLDMTVGDKPYARQIFTDGGVFKFGWSLVGSDNKPRTCEQGAVFAVVISASNVADPGAASTDEVDCEQGAGYSYGYAAGTYTVSFEAVNDLGQTRGLGADLTNRVIVAPNGITDLGNIEIRLSNGP